MNLNLYGRAKKVFLSTLALFLAGLVLVRLDVMGRQVRLDVLRDNLNAWNYWAAKPGVPARSCWGNLKSIQAALALYAQDNDDRYPPVKTSGIHYGWTDAIRNRSGFSSGWRCPEETGMNYMIALDRRSGDFTDYYLNANLSVARQGAVQEPSRTVLIGEGGAPGEQRDARYAKTGVPQDWLAGDASPAIRHLEQRVLARRGAYYLLADGRVQFVTPREFEDQMYVFHLK
jgi:hypothetical protein